LPTKPIADHRATDIVIHDTADPEVIIAEFRYRGGLDGQELTMPCVLSCGCATARLSSQGTTSAASTGYACSAVWTN
jgi:hypothetical protein